MRKLFGFFLLLTFFSCSKQKSTVEKEPLTNAKRQQMIEASFGTASSDRIAIASKKLLSNPDVSTLREIIATDKASGLKSFVYIEVNSANTASRFDISTGWMLFNDGCWHHGTLFTDDDGDSLFVADSNPYTDDYIGNEPRCMSDDEFDTYC